MSKILAIDFEYDHDYTLFGIYTPLEDFRLAFLLNDKLELKLRKYREDLDLFLKNEKSSFSIYIFDDEKKMTTWSLIANKNIQAKTELRQIGNLFDDQPIQSFLIPEKKRVDFFLKMDGQLSYEETKEIIQKIKTINQIVTLYAIDPNDLKSRDNLIFETNPDFIYQ
ncbi:IPExxxVDY family protein [Namhaeicola litoreus]|uniref:IPExxxVDY family protein n=1 Tax=Namhaeicola litoreus TaxID=1052145 RepID=A0ABW3Y2F7_9FLAO